MQMMRASINTQARCHTSRVVGFYPSFIVSPVSISLSSFCSSFSQFVSPSHTPPPLSQTFPSSSLPTLLLSSSSPYSSGYFHLFHSTFLYPYISCSHPSIISFYFFSIIISHSVINTLQAPHDYYFINRDSSHMKTSRFRCHLSPVPCNVK